MHYSHVGQALPYWALSIAGFSGIEPIIRARTVARLGLRAGDAVLDVACGRGGNFPHLVRAVGPAGRVVGLDYSPTMLAGARALIARRRWKNVELVLADASSIEYRAEFDGALCTVAMLVIPRWQEALRRMTDSVGPEGRVVVLDGRLGTGVHRVWNPYIRLFARLVAADLDRDLMGECHRILREVDEEAFLGGIYFIVSGRPALRQG